MITIYNNNFKFRYKRYIIVANQIVNYLIFFNKEQERVYLEVAGGTATHDYAEVEGKSGN